MSGYLLMKIGFSIIFVCLSLIAIFGKPVIIGEPANVITKALWSIVIIGCVVNIAGALKTQIPASTYKNMFKPVEQNQSSQKILSQRSSQKTDIIPNWTNTSYQLNDYHFEFVDDVLTHND